MAQIFKFLLLFAFIAAVLSCPSEPEPPDPDTDEDPDTPEPEEPTDPPTDDPVGQCLGEDAKDSIKEFEDGSETEAAAPEDLNCDFTGATCDCWSNNVDEDELDWVAGDDADPDAIEECWPGVDANIDGEYLLIFSDDGENRKDKAILQSCTLECIKSGTMSMDVLIKDGDLKVCARSRSDSQANPQCEDVFDSGRVTIDAFPEMEENYENIDVWLVADSMAPGSIIVVDNIEVEGEPCTTSTTSTTASSTSETTESSPDTTEETQETTESEQPDTSAEPGADLCGLNCDFESDCPAYEPVPAGQDGATATWEKNIDKVGNRDTGIRQTSPGTEGNFAGTELEGEGAALMRVSTEGASGQTMQIRFYEATKDMLLKVCTSPNLSDDNCVFASEQGVQESDREWKTASVPLDGSSDELYFICQNRGPNIGSCGLDSINVEGATGPDGQPCPQS